MFHYGDIPVFISDFVSSVQPVHQVHSTEVTIASATDTTVTLSADIASEFTASVGTVSASNPIFLTSRTGSTGKWSKVVLKVTGVAAAVLTIDPAFAITNDEKNRPQALAALSAYSVATGLVGKSAIMYERVDGTSIYAGMFGEGEGLCGFTLDMSQAIQIKYVGPVRERDQEQYRMKFYVGWK